MSPELQLNDRKLAPQAKHSLQGNDPKAPFHNVHTYFDAPDLKREFHNFRPGADRTTKGADRREFLSKTMPALAVTDIAYLKAPLRKFCGTVLSTTPPRHKKSKNARNAVNCRLTAVADDH